MTEAAVRAVLSRLPAVLPEAGRFVLAIAGPPAAGKSWLGAALAAELPQAAVLGLDAFHFDDQVLRNHGAGARSLLDRKGSPDTFDVDGYATLLNRLRTEPGATISVPEFDRSLELSRNAAQLVTPEHRIVITEGNYLLLDQAPWTSLVPLFDLTVWLDIDLSTVRERMVDRWLMQGFDEATAMRRLEHNDLPNAQLVQQQSRAADLTVSP